MDGILPKELLYAEVADPHISGTRAAAMQPPNSGAQIGKVHLRMLVRMPPILPIPHLAATVHVADGGLQAAEGRGPRTTPMARDQRIVGRIKVERPSAASLV